MSHLKSKFLTVRFNFPSPGVSKLWLTCQIRPIACCKKERVSDTKSRPLVYTLSAFFPTTKQGLRLWLTKPGIFITWPHDGKVCWPVALDNLVSSSLFWPLTTCHHSVHCSAFSSHFFGFILMFKLIAVSGKCFYCCLDSQAPFLSSWLLIPAQKSPAPMDFVCPS